MQLHSYGSKRLLAPLLLALALSSGAQAQDTGNKDVIVSTYRIAPGKQMDFIKWQAQREAIRLEAGLAATQWYVHKSGDDWDYVGIASITSETQDAKIKQIAEQRGMKTGFSVGLEIRQTMAAHADTRASGPMTAAELLAMAR